MATRTIANGGGNWSANGTWVEGVAPTASDNVVATATSGSVTIDGTSGSPNLCQSADFTNYVGTLTHAANKQLNIGGSAGGSLKLVSGMTYAPNVSAIWSFVSTTTGNTITTAGKNIPGTITFDGVGGAWQFLDSPGASNSNGTLTLTNGSLDLNGKNISTNFSSNNTNTRSLTLGASTWTINAGNNIWSISPSTGMTLSAASSIIQFTGTNTVNFTGGGLTYGTIKSQGSSGLTVNINDSNTCSTLTVITPNAVPGLFNGLGLAGGITMTVSGTFTYTGFSTARRGFIYSLNDGVRATISAATVSVTHTDIQDLIGSGSGSWNFSGLTTTANGDAGNNSGISFTIPKNCYMKTAISVNWSGSNWFTTSGGSTTIVPSVPLVHDTAIFDSNSVTAGSKTITLDMPYIPTTNWTGVLNSPTFATNAAGGWGLMGSLTLISGMSHTGTGIQYWFGRGSNTVDGGGLTFPGSTTLNIRAGAGTYTITSALTINPSLHVTSGTLALNATLSLTGLVIDGGTLTTNTNNITNSASFTLSSGTLNLASQVSNASMTISGGSINDSGTSGELKGTTISFTGGTSVVRKMTLSSTFAQSSTSVLTIPAGGSATWATSWTWTGTTFTFKVLGIPTWSSGSLTTVGLSSTFGS